MLLTSYAILQGLSEILGHSELSQMLP